MSPSSSTGGRSRRGRAKSSPAESTHPQRTLGNTLLALGLAACASACGRRAAGPQPAEARAAMELARDDRVLVLAPHPDDEVIGCGGVIQRAVAMNLPVHVVFLTYGDENEWSFAVYRKHPVLLPSAARRMGLVRHDEAVEACRVLGLAPDSLTFLGYPDFGTLQIWNAHWENAAPFESALTRARSVPYANALRPGAPYKGEEILRDLTRVIGEFRPTKVFVSHPADFHFDHRALYLFTRVALWGLEPEIHPTLHPYLVHFRKWPRPQGYHPDEPMEPPEFYRDALPWISLPLTQPEVRTKYDAVRKHKTQYESAAAYLLSFVRDRELFSDFPVVVLGNGRVEHDLAGGQGNAEADGATADQLTEEERAKFVGVEWRSTRLEGSRLVLQAHISRPLGEAVEMLVTAYGYRADVPFERMPKLHVKLTALGLQVLNQGTVLPDRTVTVRRGLHDFTVAIPLSVLGDPERILTSVRTHLKLLPLDSVAWRIIQL